MTKAVKRPTREEIYKNACDYANKQLLELVQDLSSDSAYHYPSKHFPHEYVAEIIGRINEIRADIRAGQGTPGFGKLK